MTSSILKQERSFLAGLFSLSLIIRLIFFFVFTRHGENYLIYFDSAQYQKIAQRIASGQGITNDDGSPQFYRLPGYSLFLAGLYKVFDQHDIFALLFQIILASLIPILIFLLGYILFPKQIMIAKISSVIAAIHTGFVLYAGMIATETVFTILFLGFLLFLLRAWSINSGFLFFLAGLLLGCASLVRPVGHFILLLTVVLMVLFPYVVRYDRYAITHHERDIKNRSSRVFCVSKMYRGIFLILGWLAVTSWWLIRNYLLTGFLFFHTLPGLHFLQYSATKIVMETQDCSYVHARKQLLEEWDHAIKKHETQVRRPLNDYEKCRLAEKITGKYLKQQPILAIKNAIIEMAKTCCALYSAQIIIADTGKWPDYSKDVSFWSKVKRFLLPDVNHAYLIPIIYWDIFLTILMLIGFVGFLVLCVFDKTLWSVAFATVPFIGLLVGLTLAYGCARLRFPIEPLLMILASYWWVCVYEKVKG